LLSSEKNYFHRHHNNNLKSPTITSLFPRKYHLLLITLEPANECDTLRKAKIIPRDWRRNRFMRSCKPPRPNPPLAGGPPLVYCPRLLIQYIRSYPPYLEDASSIRNLRTSHAVVTRDPPNMDRFTEYKFRDSSGGTQVPAGLMIAIPATGQCYLLGIIRIGTFAARNSKAIFKCEKQNKGQRILYSEM
jgi:hypothetical protein